MLRAAIVGATGIVGQQFVVALQGHPWIEMTTLAASERSAGKTYEQALRDAKTGSSRWYCEEEPPADVMHMPVVQAQGLDASKYDVIFTAIESDEARVLEPQLAKHAPVISTASAFRYDDDVPLLIPGVNNDHAALVKRQRQQRGWKGFILPIPNCTTTGLAISLKPIQERFGLDAVIMTSMQAISGAGRSPGVISLDILDNVIPFISGEEEKVQRETQKILGQYVGEGIAAADFKVSCTCTRVNVKDGHTEAVFAATRRPCSVEDVRQAMLDYADVLADKGLPSAPQRFIVVRDDPFRPQPRLDRDAEGGMATVVGRLRKDTVLENGIKYMLVSHNTKMGAAKGAVLVAELLHKDGYL